MSCFVCYVFGRFVSTLYECKKSLNLFTNIVSEVSFFVGYPVRTLFIYAFQVECLDSGNEKLEVRKKTKENNKKNENEKNPKKMKQA